MVQVTRFFISVIKAYLLNTVNKIPSCHRDLLIQNESDSNGRVISISVFSCLTLSKKLPLFSINFTAKHGKQ